MWISSGTAGEASVISGLELMQAPKLATRRSTGRICKRLAHVRVRNGRSVPGMCLRSIYDSNMVQTRPSAVSMVACLVACSHDDAQEDQGERTLSYHVQQEHSSLCQR